MERGSIWRPNVEISPSCPRCGSSNTKFCYYNNYSLTQPRYFCKGCRRYWTKGGSLRNVPVGGGCRKSRRGKSSNNLANNGKSFANCVGVPNRVESSNSGSNIDLALVYANFLNPRMDSPKTELPSTSSSEDHRLDDLPAKLSNTPNTAADHPSGGLLLQVEDPSSSSLPGWSTEINDHPNILYGAFDSVNIKNHDHTQQERSTIISNGPSNYVLPPLPGEEAVSINHHENFVWMDSPVMDNNSTPIEGARDQTVHFGDEADDPTNLLFGNWSPFDFSSDDTMSRT